MPGVFSSFAADTTSILDGLTFLFPGVQPNTSEVERQELHNEELTHADDEVPNRIYAGGDILDMVLSVAKQTRIGAGQDIINMMFFGQNLSSSDITRITAGRDITATTELVAPLIGLDQGQRVYGDPEPAVQGNTFVLGGRERFSLRPVETRGRF